MHAYYDICIFIYTAGGVLSLNYEGILTRFGALAVYLAIGEVSRGKSIAAKLVVAACCNYPRGYLQMLTVSLAKDLLRGGLPFAFDDPDNDEILKPLLMNSFGGQKWGPARINFQLDAVP